jgi:hypothetical protein
MTMKKNYIQPQVVELKFSAPTLLAGSTVNMNEQYADEELTNKCENTGCNNFWE